RSSTSSRSIPARCMCTLTGGSRAASDFSSRTPHRLPARVLRPPWCLSPAHRAMSETDGLLARRLALLGLRDIETVCTHTNRTLMVRLNARRVLRLHRGYAMAPDRVLRAIVRFLNPRVARSLRRLAEREFLAFPVEQHAPAEGSARRDRPKPGDLVMLHRLQQLH